MLVVGFYKKEKKKQEDDQLYSDWRDWFLMLGKLEQLCGLEKQAREQKGVSSDWMIFFFF